jgi:hypothetical protein
MKDFERFFVRFFLNNSHDVLNFIILKFICTKQGEVCHGKLVVGYQHALGSQLFNNMVVVIRT